MGSAISSTVTMGLTYCCCTAAGSLCESCLGTTAPGTTGRKRSVLLLTIAITVALWFQYSVGPAIVSQEGLIWKMYRFIPGMGRLVYSAWNGPCEAYHPDKDTQSPEEQERMQRLLEQCAGNSGVYRPMFVSTLFFAASAVATRLHPSLNREVWPAKLAMFGFVVALTMFIPSYPLFTGFFLWAARLGATAFVLLQQVILIDVAYNWNEDWVDRADQADRLSYGSGSAWLRAIVGTSVAFFVATITGVSLLYKHFGDHCPENTWIITLTLLGILTMTAIQLSGTEGSLLTSSVMALYITYLAYSMVSKNPRGQCNPQLGNNDVTGIIVGLTLTAVSCAWSGWSWTAEERLNADSVQSARTVSSNKPPAAALNLDVPFLDPDQQQPPQGLVMDAEDDTAALNASGGLRPDPGVGAHIWKLNVVMALISCFVAMTLTAWGSIEELTENENAANPTVGRVNMAMIGISQWLAILLYIWTLVAPRLFPDRDFS